MPQPPRLPTGAAVELLDAFVGRGVALGNRCFVWEPRSGWRGMI
jgi:hypothetical protein